MDTKAFFDLHAPQWDSYQTPETHEVITRIFAAAGLAPGLRVLDVGAGTGILYPYFRAALVSAYLGLDMAPEMVRLFKAKHPEAEVFEAGFESSAGIPSGAFDLVMIFNVFPHFLDETAAFHRAHASLVPGGRLIICHSMNRDALNEHHRRAGEAVTNDILAADSRFRELYEMFDFRDVHIENGDFFYSEGTA